ncbi:3-carboxy-cis,cis-muconate cycloisomerase [Myceligenerans cantabricum]
MTDTGLLTPGLHGPAQELTDDVAVLRGMLQAETAWVEAQAGLGLVPATVHDATVHAAETLLGGAGHLHGPATDEARRLAAALAEESSETGNPVMPLVRRLRQALPAEAPHGSAEALHTGLTSQDVVDTALMLVVTDAVGHVRDDLRRARTALAALAREHRSTPVLARTLAQPAVPTTFGARAATWLQATAEADASLTWLDQPVAWGGAAGTLDKMAGPAQVRFDVVDAWALCLGLSVSAAPWHVTRFPVLQTGAALAEVCAALGKLASDVLTGVRAGELHEPSAPGRGASSTMAHKQNPVLSLLLRRSALAAPGALQTLHTAAGLAVDERPDGAWHAEWPALRDLARHAVGAAALAAELLDGLSVDPAVASANLTAGLGAAEGGDTGVPEALVDRVLARYPAVSDTPSGGRSPGRSATTSTGDRTSPRQS